MNRFFPLAIMIVLAGFHACTGDEQQHKNPNTARILSSSSFAGLSDSIERFPDNVELRLRRAILLSQKNLHEEATPDYKHAWDLTGDEGVALEYASNLLLSGKYNRAVSLLKECETKFQDNTEFSRRLGEIYMQNGDNNKALQEFDKIISRDSSNFEAWFDRGILMSRLKDTAEAIRSLEISFSIVPINYTGVALANIYVAQKDPRAIEICNFLISNDSARLQTEPLFLKGAYYADRQMYDSAIAQFDECIRRDWKMTDAYIEKGIIWFERENFDEALKIFSMAATVSNTDADAYYWMGRCFESTGQRDQAILNYERALSLDRSFTEARDALRRLNS
jgi:tetratricopeptide (TPR) repeat protein